MWVFANCRFVFSMNAEKEQFSAAQAGLEKERAGKELACMPRLCRVAMVLPIAGVVGMRPRT